jgi:hypothetical protein
LTEVADRFGLDFAEARTLRGAALGLAGKAPPRKGRWNPPTRPGPKRRGKR